MAKETIITAEELVSMRNDYKHKQRERVSQEGYEFETDIIFMEALRNFSEIANQTKSIAEIVVHDVV